MDEWMLHLISERQLTESTIRNYQGAIRLFCEYITSSHYHWAQECEVRFGTHPVQVCHEWSTTAHLTDYEGRPGRRPMTRGECQALFDHADDQVERAIRLGRKGALTAYRDATVFKTIYACPAMLQLPPRAGTPGTLLALRPGAPSRHAHPRGQAALRRLRSPREPCIRCRQPRKVQARLPEGPLCKTCAKHDPALHRPCGDCGSVDRLHHDRCPACAYPHLLRELLTSDNGQLRPELEPVFAALTASEPQAGLAMLERPSRRKVLAALATSCGPLTHDALDQLGSPQGVRTLRTILINAEVLPWRSGTPRAIWIIVFTLVGLLVGVVAGGLSSAAGAVVPTAVLAGDGAFAGTIALLLAVAHFAAGGRG